MAAAVSEAPESALLRFSRWGLIATVAGMPLYVIRWHYGPLPTTLLETLIIATVALYVVARWRDGWRRPLTPPHAVGRVRWGGPVGVYDLPILALLLAGAIAVVVATDHRGALGLYRAFFVEPIAVFYVAIDLLRKHETMRNAVLGFAAGSTVLTVLNLAAFAQALAANNIQVGSAPNAVYGDANYVAMYLEPPVAMATALILFPESPRWRWLGLGWLAITGLALVLTLSKASYLALGMLAVLVVLSVRRWRLPIFIGLALIAAAASQLPIISARFARSEDALVGRFQIFGATMRLMKGHEIFGLGLTGYDVNFRGYTTQPYPHDIWLAFWVELGLLGLIAFTVITFLLLWQGWRAWPRVEGFHRAALWGGLAGIVLWLVHGIFDSPYWKNDMAVEYWFFAAIVVVAVARLAAPSRAEVRT